jgi:hephaestin
MRAPSTTTRLTAAASFAAILQQGCTDDAFDVTNDHGGRFRDHYVAAEEIAWDYAPSGRNLVTGMPFGELEDTWVAQGPERIGRIYVKALYRAYTDDTFSTPLPVDAAREHLGMLGPLIHAEVGDTIRLHLRNDTSRPVSVHPHGVFYDKASEGAGYADGTDGDDLLDDAVAPGDTYTYVWEVPERAGPGPSDGSSIFWEYHSHADPSADVYAGLIGGIVVTAKGRANADGSPADVDREFVTMFFVDDENESPYLRRNVATYAGHPDRVDPEDEAFEESNLMHGVNGYVYGNLPGLTMSVGERVRWYTFALGTEVDLHTPHWHGNTVTVGGHREDVLELLPASVVTADMIPDAPGTWMLHCHVDDHMMAGMSALYTVEP